tara:strand:+ start:716 stop:2332 length:1617 start_codon:yes stop_codon:yes gene_type:complete
MVSENYGVGYNSDTIEGRYNICARDRELFLERGRDCSQYTIPTLIPDEGHTSTTRFYTTYQGVGARGVNNLASKLLLTLLPPNAPFFRFSIDNFVLKDMEGDENLKTEIDKGLVEVEKAVMEDIEISSDRVALFEAIKHLIVGGNVLLFVSKEGLRVFPLERYVCKRDPMGNVLEIITKETININVLPDEVREAVYKTTDPEDVGEKTCDLYTCVKRGKTKFEVFQEVKGIAIKETYGTYPIEKTPYMPLRMIRVDGENYGRSYAEEYLGDLKSLEGLTKAIVEGSSASAKTLFLIKPNGTTRARALAQSENGAIIEGDANDVSTLQVQKFADFRVAQETMAKIEQRLSYAFLLNASVIRDSERTTAEEVKLTAQELQDSLGGIYGILSQEFQLPFVRRKIAILEKANKLPNLPKKVVRPKIVTGLEALGRGNDRNRLVQFLQTLAGTLGAEAVVKYVDVSEAIARLATADGIEVKGLIKSQEDLQAEAQQQQEQMMQDQQQQALTQAGGKIAGNIPPKSIGQALAQQQGLPMDETEE